MTQKSPCKSYAVADWAVELSNQTLSCSNTLMTVALPSADVLQLPSARNNNVFPSQTATKYNQFKNLVNAGAITNTEITLLIRVPSYSYWTKIGYRPSFVALAFPNALDDWNGDRRVKRGDDTCTCGINLVGFCKVLLELTCLNCVQEASISTRVNSSTFSRGQHGCVLLLLARGRYSYAGPAIRWVLPSISSHKECDCTAYEIIITPRFEVLIMLTP